MSTLDFEAKCEVNSDDEIGNLASTLISYHQILNIHFKHYKKKIINQKEILKKKETLKI